MMEIEEIVSLPFYTEGPALDSWGNIYCSTLSGGTILKIDAENKIEQYARIRHKQRKQQVSKTLGRIACIVYDAHTNQCKQDRIGYL